MKTIRISIAILAIVAMGISKGYGQQADSVKRRSVNYYSRFLKTDSATARQVSDVQDSYKKGLGEVIGNALLTEQQKRSMIDSLVNEKNRRLEELLPADQRNLIIPSTERKRTWKRDSTARTNR